MSFCLILMSVCFVIISFVADHEMYQLYYISFSETSTSRLLNIIQSSQITTDKVEFPSDSCDFLIASSSRNVCIGFCCRCCILRSGYFRRFYRRAGCSHNCGSEYHRGSQNCSESCGKLSIHSAYSFPHHPCGISKVPADIDTEIMNLRICHSTCRNTSRSSGRSTCRSSPSCHPYRPCSEHSRGSGSLP